ncbi:MAG: hypothetical protein HYZ53_28035, partial [Planctomycetes bacterium]|nr:hypothetical protein [Planctomycetota bacterium]
RAPLPVRRRWAELIKRVYEVDPLVCSRCGATMKIVAFITDPTVLARSLSHLGLASPAEDVRGPPTGRSPTSSVSPADEFEVQTEFAWDQTGDEAAWTGSDASAGEEVFGHEGPTDERFFEIESHAEETFDAGDPSEGE